MSQKKSPKKIFQSHFSISKISLIILIFFLLKLLDLRATFI